MGNKIQLRLNGDQFAKKIMIIRVYFKNGFKMRSLDNNFKFQAGGRIMHDWGFFTYEEIQNVEFPNL